MHQLAYSSDAFLRIVHGCNEIYDIVHNYRLLLAGSSVCWRRKSLSILHALDTCQKRSCQKSISSANHYTYQIKSGKQKKRICAYIPSYIKILNYIPFPQLKFLLEYKYFSLNRIHINANADKQSLGKRKTFSKRILQSLLFCAKQNS